MASVLPRMFVGQQGLKIFGGLTFLACGAAGIGTMAVAMPTLQTKGFTTLIQSLELAGVNTGHTMADVQGVLAGGAIGVAAGLVALLGAANKEKFGCLMTWLAIALAIASGVIMLAMGASISSDSLSVIINDDNVFLYTNPTFANRAPTPVPLPLTLNDQEARLLSWANAFEDQCCGAQNGWDLFALPTTACDPTCPQPASITKTSAIYGQTFSTFLSAIGPSGSLGNIDLNIICACNYPGYNATYAAVYDGLTPSMCNALTTIGPQLPTNDKIPTTAITVGNLQALIFSSEASIMAPFVGPGMNSGLSLKLTPPVTVVPGYGYGCGLGFSKGLLWYLQLYWDQQVDPLATQGLAIGGAMLGAVALLLISSVFIIRTEDADADADNWENMNRVQVQDKPSAFVASPAPQMQMQPQQPPASDYAAQNPQFRGPGVQVSNAPAPGAGVPLDQIVPQVRDFYRKYDPSKSDEDVQGISRWASQNGLAALNKKLRDKYGADLETLRGPPV